MHWYVILPIIQSSDIIIHISADTYNQSDVHVSINSTRISTFFFNYKNHPLMDIIGKFAADANVKNCDLIIQSWFPHNQMTIGTSLVSMRIMAIEENSSLTNLNTDMD